MAQSRGLFPFFMPFSFLTLFLFLTFVADINLIPMKLNRVHHVAVLCSNYERSLAFYTEVLGLEVLSEHYRAERQSYKTDLALNGEFVVELFSFPDPPKRVTNPEAAGLRHLAFEVDDVEAALAAVHEKGVPHEQVRIDPLSGKKFVFCFDPDNLPIEFYEKA